MIPSPIEIAYSLYGAWRLARLDVTGMELFDRSVAGFWKSFFAAVLVAPAYLAMVLIELGGMTVAAGPLAIFIVQSLVYVIVWLAYPLIMFYLTDQIGRAEKYIGFVVALNWASVIQMLAFMPVIFFNVAEVLPNAILGLVTLGLFLAILFYQGFVTRTALDISGVGTVLPGEVLGVESFPCEGVPGASNARVTSGPGWRYASPGLREWLGGSLSHHHGVGKLRQGFVPRILSPAGVAWSAELKRAVDPDDVFGIANLCTGEEAPGGGGR